MLQLDIITIFPDIFGSYFNESIIKRAQKKKLVKINIHNLRKWTLDKHKTVDDKPYGGGAGMVMKVEPTFKAISEIKKSKIKNQKSKVILLTPQGKLFNQKIAKRLSKLKQIILICGHYEGVDERTRKHLVDEEISIGDYVLTGGELPAMVLADTIIRLIPGVVGKKDSVKYESFEKGLLDYPQYTRPENFKGWKAPKILLSGNHKKIQEWRMKKAIEKTKKRRPDLLK